MTATALDRETIIAKIIAALTTALEDHARSALAALEESTVENNKTEVEIGEGTSCGLESSFLAEAQSRLAAELREALAHYQTLAVQKFVPRETIQTGAIVELERAGELLTCFLGPKAGGTEIECDGRPILVITPASPMGRQLIGRRQGEILEIKVGRTTETYRIAEIE